MFIVGGIAMGVAGIAGSVINANAAGSAADKQAAAARYAADLQNQQYQQTRADQQPWRQAGSQALSQMGDPSFQHTFGASDFQEDPGYQFRMQQGADALQRSAAARGGLMNGGTAKALTEYGQNFASNEYQNAYNRFNNDQSLRFNRLSSLAGLGQTANSDLDKAGANYADNSSMIAMNNAKAQGAAGIAGANALSGGISGLGNAAMQYGMMNQYYPSAPASISTLSNPVANSGGYNLGLNYDF